MPRSVGHCTYVVVGIDSERYSLRQRGQELPDFGNGAPGNALDRTAFRYGEAMLDLSILDDQFIHLARRTQHAQQNAGKPRQARSRNSPLVHVSLIIGALCPSIPGDPGAG